MTMQEVREYLDRKIDNNPNELIITFYEARIKLNLSEEETDALLAHCKTRLENIGYQVFFTGAKFSYNGENRVVKDNELMVAIKAWKYGISLL